MPKYMVLLYVNESGMPKPGTPEFDTQNAAYGAVYENFAKRGAFVSGGRIAPKGGLAVNTNGGGLSYCHPGMYGLFLLIEAVRQLRGECGARQVKDCQVALAHGNGGVLSSQATVILGTQAAL